MRNFITYTLLLFTLIFARPTFGQDSFSKFENNKEVNSYIVNKKMFDMMSNVKVDPSNQQEKAYFDIIKNMNNLRVFSTNNNVVKDQMRQAVTQHVANKKLIQHSTERNQQNTVTVYLDKNVKDSNFSDFLLYMESDDSNQQHMVFILEGKLNTKDIKTIMHKMDLPVKDLIPN